MPKRIAIVEDEAELASLIEYNLTRHGYETEMLPGTAGTLKRLEQAKPDLILLDVMLPDADGFELCRQIRASATLARIPVLFLTARSDEVDRVLGLEIGGDDYMTKPFSPRELVARVKAHLRRGEMDTDTAGSAEIGPFRLDRTAHRVFLRGRELQLTSTEFNLLEFFLAHPGRAYSRDQLLESVWGEQRFVTPRTVDVHVRRLREQIEEQPDTPKYLTTVRGFGYRFEGRALTTKIFLKLIVWVVLLMAVAVAMVDELATNVAKDNYIQNLTAQLADKGRMIGLTPPGPAQFTPEMARAIAQAAGGRLTVVRSDGKVLVDSEADASTMENHRDPNRPELLEAFAGRVGQHERLSATLRVKMLYVAAPVGDGSIAVRLAVPLKEIDGQVNSIRLKVLIATAIAFLPAILIAALLARYLSRRFAAVLWHAGELAKGNFRARLSKIGGGEFGQLSQTLNETAGNLETTVAQLQHEHAELEKLERVRKDFVINVSHELRTPLASIQGYTETLIDGAIHDPAHNMRFLGIIRHNAERLARLTEDLLTLSRVEQKRQKFEFDLHMANQLIHDAFDLVRPIAEKGRITLVEERAPEDALVCCDSEAVSQILSNLLDNAIKYTPAGGVIAVGAQPAGEMVEFYVRDSGVGIPEEDLPRLFERFYRVDKARSRELGGTGLGLSIVKHLVAAHNGVTRVESLLGKGSTFFFTLPTEESALPQAVGNAEVTA